MAISQLCPQKTKNPAPIVFTRKHIANPRKDLGDSWNEHGEGVDRVD